MVWSVSSCFVSMKSDRDLLISLLKNNPNDPSLEERISGLEEAQPADLSLEGSLLKGVWDLRWSSSSQPWLRQTPWLENLQALDPDRNRGCNFLRLRGPLGAIGAITVEASLNVVDSQRVEVKFLKGGWLGPKVLGGSQLKLLREVQQSFPAWLDITVLDDQIRICRGNAGTTFALLRKPEVSLSDCNLLDP